MEPPPTSLRQAAWGEAAGALDAASPLAEVSRRAESRRGRSGPQESTLRGGGQVSNSEGVAICTSLINRF
jgi:hypothetical protein